MLTPAVKKAILKAMREYDWPTSRDGRRNLRLVDYAINERAGWRRQIERRQVGGVVAVCRSGMDCDCTQYARTEHLLLSTFSLFSFQRSEWKHREWLDGPETMWFADPTEEKPRYASADRALEAYEDGHPSVVYWGDL